MNKKHVMIGAVIIAAALIVGGAYFLLDTREAEEIEFAGTVLEDGGKLGLMVPDYTKNKLGLESISDLNEYVDTFDRKIIGIDQGAGIMKMTREAIEHYDLNYTLQSSSEAGMISELKGAVENNEHILVTLWDPHWSVAQYNMVYLDDEDLIYGEAETIESWTRGGLLDSDEDFAKLMRQFSFGDDVDAFNELLSYVENYDGNVSEATEDWLLINSDLKAQWLDGLEDKANRGHIDIGYVEWSCATATSNILKHLLEEIGYSAKINSGEAGPMFTGLAYGDLDVVTTVWTPITHEHYLDQYASPDWNTFTVNFDTDGGNEIDNLAVKYGEDIDLIEIEPVREGYNFVKWTYEGEDVPAKMPYRDITLEAVWESVEA